MLNFTQFRVFYHVAKHLNFTRAAADLCISQPAVTAQMKAFESFCGFTLFKKKGRKNWITDEGKLLFDFAERLFKLEKEIDGAINDMKALKRGVLRIGTTKAYARYFMPLMLSTFHGRHPAIKIELNEGSSMEMSLSLTEFKNEVAIVAKAGDIPDIQFIPFSQEEMTVIAAPGHPLTRRSEIGFNDLADEPFIMKDKGSGTRRLVDAMFERCGRTPDILMEVSNAEFIKQLVGRGDGISCLVRESVTTELASGELAAVPLKGEKVYLDVSIAYLKDQRLSPPARAFLDTLKQLRYGRDLTPQGIGAFMAKILTQNKQQ